MLFVSCSALGGGVDPHCTTEVGNALKTVRDVDLNGMKLARDLWTCKECRALARGKLRILGVTRFSRGL